MLIAAPRNSVNAVNPRADRPSGYKYNASPGPHGERHGDAHVADQHHRAAPPANQRRVEFQAHQEHEQQEPDLAQRAEVSQARRRKQSAESEGAPSPGTRTEQNPRDHFAHHLRLSDLAEQQPTSRAVTTTAATLQQQRDQVGHEQDDSAHLVPRSDTWSA
jgi:hypothetical protein